MTTLKDVVTYHREMSVIQAGYGEDTAAKLALRMAELVEAAQALRESAKGVKGTTTKDKEYGYLIPAEWTLNDLNVSLAALDKLEQEP